jgi:5-methylcytosine-specific restriction endonuclease McrA
MSRLINIQGQTFGRWTVLNYVGIRPSDRRAVWRCQCICGNFGEVTSQDLRDGHSKSCGCLREDVIRERSQTKDSGRNKLFRQYKTSSKRRGLIFSLSMEQFENLTRSSCHYCGTKPQTISRKCSEFGSYLYNGIDRKNNDLGYTIENCVPCCQECNFLKSVMSYTNFLKRIKMIYLNLICKT